MSSVWIVTRHEGALDWARQKGLIDHDAYTVHTVSEIQPGDVELDDYVIGTLPVHLVAEICARGAHYLHITMQVPAERRGTELTASEMDAFGARCREFLVLPSVGETTARAAHVRAHDTDEGVHVCIISDQFLANLLPVLKSRPAHVALICTSRMEKGSQKLADAIKYFGRAQKINLSSLPIDDASSTDFAIARAEARRVRETLLDKFPRERLTVNVTGGTKIMSAAFLLEFQGFEVIYTDSQNGSFIRFMDTAPREAEPIGSQILRIEDYLYCQGYKIEKAASDQDVFCQTAERRAEMTNLLADYRGHTLSKLNVCAGKFEKETLLPIGGKFAPRTKKKVTLDKALSTRPIPKLAEKDAVLCEQLVTGGLLVKLENQKFAFASAEAMSYLTGGWIEEWAWLIARNCGADEVKANVTVSFLDNSRNPSADNAADNELDLVVLYNNRLLIAECKTIEWRGAAAKQEIFNKLDALSTHARGLFGRSLLISAKTMDERARRRAKAYGIQVLEGSSMSKLKEEILRWMDGKG